MALQGQGRLVQAEASRTVVYLPQAVVKDSQFPFSPRDKLVVRIDPKKGRLTIEKAE